MCPQCQAEYENPEDRRFHAQPNACPVCGPQLELRDAEGTLVAGISHGTKGGAISSAAEAVRAGAILAVKGLGGFHLIADASDDEAVRRLRDRKHREEKPFALMFPSLESIRKVCLVSRLEERVLLSPEAPIVLLHRIPFVTKSSISPAIAPGNPNLGVLLPYTPLHHLLLGALGFPVVATSGNLSDEPICIDDLEAVERLKGIADLFLVHNRPIVRHVDDSIVRVMAGRELVLRRARGYAPLPIQVRSAECGMRNEGILEGSAECGVRMGGILKGKSRDTAHSALETVLAVGAHLKNAIALATGSQVFISQHIGDLETAQAYDAFQRVISDFQRLYESPAACIAGDAHPDYLSTKFAQAAGLPFTSVQHHVAHVLSCMAENEIAPPALGVAWDGTGYGLDGTIWGGEFFQIRTEGAQRVAHLRQFRLPGGEQAVKEPRRCALGLLFGAFGEVAFDRPDLVSLAAFSSAELAVLRKMLTQNLSSPLTSSVGRLFDAMASLMNVRQRAGFEGQAAMELEFLINDRSDPEAYNLALDETSFPVVLDWRPGIESALTDLKSGVGLGTISARFHNMLVESIVAVARRTGLERVALSGGCFQNRYLTEQAVRRLSEEGFRPYWHQRIPPNDGGVCLGQVVAARWWKV